ncbi:hypothetical protein SteCoe_2106 [Stentor coeruleus]|uniref:Serine aminopeptidase S33 domain-containing protein n=1 Tax=Stentor coeruleus TaxID=5963 RepID=A0A1R2D031_9CILI|nr:hypothetical protein SteCoe_2106 [Stentor coeruleus]
MDYISNDHGIKLAYNLHLSENETNNVVILIHDALSDRNNTLFQKLAENLACNSIRFDMQGNGDSEGVFSLAGYGKEIDDIHCTVNWARAQGYKVVALIGHGKGANEIMMYSAKYADVPLIVSITPRCDMKLLPQAIKEVLPQIEANGAVQIDVRGKIFNIEKAAIGDYSHVDMVKVAKNVKAWTCLIHSKADEEVPHSESADLNRHLGKMAFEFHLLENFDHYFTNSDSEISTLVNNFLTKTLPLLRLKSLI